MERISIIFSLHCHPAIIFYFSATTTCATFFRLHQCSALVSIPREEKGGGVTSSLELTLTDPCCPEGWSYLALLFLFLKTYTFLLIRYILRNSIPNNRQFWAECGRCTRAKFSVSKNNRDLKINIKNLYTPS